MSAPFPQMTPEQARASLLANTQTGSLFDLPNVGRYLRDVKNAGQWLLPYLGAATASAPAYAIGAAKYGVPEIRKGYSQDGIVGALGGLNEAARKVPVIGDASVNLMDAATQYAEEQGAPAPAMFLADMLAPDPTGKIGALASGAAALAKGMGGLNLAVLPAFVGSPRRWSANDELGRLTTRYDKINTGEGAQVQGYGHYSAEHPDTAKSYAPRRYDVEEVLLSRYDDAVNAQDYRSAEVYEAALLHQSPQEIRNRYKSEFDLGNITREDMEAIEPALSGVDGLGGTQNVYGVLHDVDPEDLLDLDAPLSQQSPKVRAASSRAFESVIGKEPRSDFGDLTGAELRNIINNRLRGQLQDSDAASVETSNVLREAGIPGSMFYDQLSRDSGEGTRNYVMFGDDLTYVDPSRTAPALIGDMPVGAPYRTVKPGTPVTVRGYKGMYPYTGGRSYNAAGEVVDETPASLIDEFDSPGRPWAGFFSPDPKVANRFSGVTEDGRVPGFEGGAVTPADIRFENPKVIDAQGDFAASVQFDPGTARYSDEFLSHFDDHDGVIITNTRDEGDIFIPRDNAQIEGLGGAADEAVPAISTTQSGTGALSSDAGLGGLAAVDDAADQAQTDALTEWARAMDFDGDENLALDFADAQRRAARLLEDPEGTRARFARLVNDNPNVAPAWRYSVGEFPAAATPEQAVENAMSALRSQVPRRG